MLLEKHYTASPNQQKMTKHPYKVLRQKNNNGICVFDHWALIREQLLRYKCNEARCYEVYYAQ